MSGSPKYTLVGSGPARAARRTAERLLREQRRGAERARAEAEAREAARVAAERERRRALDEAERRAAERARVAAEQIEIAEARLRSLVRDARECGVQAPLLAPIADTVTQARHLLNDRKTADQAVSVAASLAAAVDRAEDRLDDEITRLTSRRELLGVIVDALPGLGFAVAPDSLHTGDDGSLGLHATRHSGEIIAVVVAPEGDDDRVSYLADPTRTGADGHTLDPASCHFVAELAETVNSPAREAGFEAGAVRWDDDETGAIRQPPPGGGAVGSPVEREAGR